MNATRVRTKDSRVCHGLDGRGAQPFFTEIASQPVIGQTRHRQLSSGVNSVAAHNCSRDSLTFEEGVVCYSSATWIPVLTFSIFNLELEIRVSSIVCIG